MEGEIMLVKFVLSEIGEILMFVDVVKLLL